MKKIDVKSRGFTFLTALLFAIVFWVFVIVDSNPTRIADIRNVPIEVRGEESLIERGLVIRSKGRESCTVRMEGTNNVLSTLDSESISAYVDVSRITGEGEYELTIQAVNTAYNSAVVRSVNSRHMEIEVDRYVEKEVPIEVQLDGNLPDDQWLSKPVLNQERVKISGAAKDVDGISRAVCRLPVETVLNDARGNANSLFEASINLEFYNEAGERVNYSENRAVIVSVEVLSKKTVPVNFSGAYTGRPANGYRVTGVQSEVKEVQIAGKKAVLDTVAEVTAGGLSISGARQNVTGNVNINPIEGVEIVNNSQLTVTVEIGEE